MILGWERLGLCHPAKAVVFFHLFRDFLEEKDVLAISYKGKTFQILPHEYRLSFFKAKVEVHEYVNGSIHIFYPGKKLKHKPISQERIKSLRTVIEPKENELVTINYGHFKFAKNLTFLIFVDKAHKKNLDIFGFFSKLLEEGVFDDNKSLCKRIIIS